MNLLNSDGTPIKTITCALLKPGNMIITTLSEDDIKQIKRRDRKILIKRKKENEQTSKP